MLTLDLGNSHSATTVAVTVVLKNVSLQLQVGDVRFVYAAASGAHGEESTSTVSSLVSSRILLPLSIEYHARPHRLT